MRLPNKRPALPAPKKAALRYRGYRLDMDTEESLLGETHCRALYNLKPEGGALVAACGPKAWEKTASWHEPEGDTGAIMYYRRYDREAGRQDDKLVIYAGKDSPLYYIDLYGSGEVKRLSYAPFNEPPNFINYRLDGEDVLIMSSASDSMAVWNGGDGLEVVADAPRINSMCVHYERLFATDAGEGASLWFSDDLDPRNWSVSLDEAGFIELVDLKGRLLAVVSFLDYVYVFRSYGISRLSAYGDQTQFAVHELFTGTGRILPGSIALSGDRILFLARDGLYSFDGLTARRLELGLDALLSGADTSCASACYLSGKYYVAFRYDFGDGRAVGCENGAFRNNVLLEYDVADSAFSLTRGVDVASMTALSLNEGAVAAVLYREEGRLKLGRLEEAGAAELGMACAFGRTDLGEPEKRKLVKRVSVQSATEVTLTVEADGVPHRYPLPAGGGTVRPNLLCTAFRVRAEPEGAGARLTGPQVWAEVIG